MTVYDWEVLSLYSRPGSIETPPLYYRTLPPTPYTPRLLDACTPGACMLTLGIPLLTYAYGVWYSIDIISMREYI